MRDSNDRYDAALEAVMLAAEGRKVPVAVAVRIMAVTGVRPTELHALTWAPIKRDSGRG